MVNFIFDNLVTGSNEKSDKDVKSKDLPDTLTRVNRFKETIRSCHTVIPEELPNQG